MVQNSSFECKKISIEVYKKKNNCQNFSNNLIDLIKKYEEGRIIIYYAI